MNLKQQAAQFANSSGKVPVFVAAFVDEENYDDPGPADESKVCVNDLLLLTVSHVPQFVIGVTEFAQALKVAWVQLDGLLYETDEERINIQLLLKAKIFNQTEELSNM